MMDIDARFKGDRNAGAQDTAKRGWAFLMQDNVRDAAIRFNQVLLIDPRNGSALWGMAKIQTDAKKYREALVLFADVDVKKEIDERVQVDFTIDYARTAGLSAATSALAEPPPIDMTKPSALSSALKQFEALHKQYPERTANLENWALTLFIVGKYPQSWRVVKLAETTPRSIAIDPEFIKMLTAKMPRPN